MNEEVIMYILSHGLFHICLNICHTEIHILPKPPISVQVQGQIWVTRAKYGIEEQILWQIWRGIWWHIWNTPRNYLFIVHVGTISSYRPLSLVSEEHIITEHMRNHIESKHICQACQHEVLCFTSLNFIQELTGGISEADQHNAHVMDFSNASSEYTMHDYLRTRICSN